ncbi:hypothetical protein LTR15_006264 [Elasticomyces elasticus]|nr:hypothetical protein LTR15_006264 [Elasticomyces elasticus]
MAAPPFKVKAIYEYASEHDDDLKFPIGQVINVTELEGDDWYVGEFTDSNGAKQEGLFPSNFVEKYEPAVPTRPTRAARPKSVVQAPAPAAAQQDDGREQEQEEVPPLPVMSKPQPPPVEVPATSRREEEVTSTRSTVSQPVQSARAEPPPAPKPTPAEPAERSSTPVKGAPPVAPKSNAFKDKIAAFNRPEASPVAPIQPGARGGGGRNDYIKKPFVAPPPKRDAYIPMAQKVEPVHKPYIREEDPEIRRTQEQDHAAAEAAGLTGETTQEAEEEDAPKPISLKERIANLQREQEATRARHVEPATQKERKPVAKKSSESSERPAIPPQKDEGEDEDTELERVPTQRQSLDVNRERPRVPSAQRQPAETPMSPVPSVPEHEILSGGEEADHEMTEDDTGTVGPNDHVQHRQEQALPRAPTAPVHEADVGDEEDTNEEPGEEEEEMDEEEARKQRLRERMARLAGGQQGGGPFNPFGMPPVSAPAKKRPAKERQDDTPSSPQQQQMHQMIAIPGMSGAPPPPARSHSPDPETPAKRSATEPVSHAEEENEEPIVPPPRRATAEDRGGAPPVPKGKIHRKPLLSKRKSFAKLWRSDSKVDSVAFSLSSSPSKDVRETQQRKELNRPIPALPSQDRSVPPSSVDTSRPVPRPPPAESRALPPPPPARNDAPMSPGPGSESDDEMSMHAKHSSAEMSGFEQPIPIRTALPPVPPARETPRSPLNNKRASYFGSEPSSATSDRRASRAPPPVPGSPISSPRPPPPPPPSAAPPNRAQTMDLQPPALENTERGESDYEGDYDTDIASSAKHKDALKSHVREPSRDDSTTADEITPPAVPEHAAPRAVPPPPPQSQTRQSVDAPRAPPPIPPPGTRMPTGENGEYDPYNYTGASRAPPPVPGAVAASAPPIPLEDLNTQEVDDSSADDVPSATSAPTRKSTDRAPPPMPQADRAPPMPATSALPQAPPPTRSMPRQSLDVARSSTVRRSMDQSRPMGENGGQIAQDIDLAQTTQWWVLAQPLPPSLQARNGVDLLSESEESQKSKRGGRTTISKDIYVLYMDYSQTVITAQYDSKDPSDVALEQRHEPPPAKLRQDQLEGYWQRFGSKIAAAANAVGHGKGKETSSIGDGSPANLPLELIKAQAEALLPVGTKAYGALVYANLANASTMQFDEIRPGDVVTLRNAKFEGHHGAIKSKYKVDYGMSHVGVVEEWDGTRRSVRFWEQGREKKGGVRSDKLRLGDLRSGEVRVWRVVGREWVGWTE